MCVWVWVGTVAAHAHTHYVRTTHLPRLAPWQNQSAHDNLNENLPIFAAAVIACMTMGVPVATCADTLPSYHPWCPPARPWEYPSPPLLVRYLVITPGALC